MSDNRREDTRWDELPLLIEDDDPISISVEYPSHRSTRIMESYPSIFSIACDHRIRVMMGEVPIWLEKKWDKFDTERGG